MELCLRFVVVAAAALLVSHFAFPVPLAALVFLVFAADSFYSFHGRTLVAHGLGQHSGSILLRQLVVFYQKNHFANG